MDFTTKTVEFSGKMELTDFKQLFFHQILLKILWLLPLYAIIIAVLLYIVKIFLYFNISILVLAILSLATSLIFVAVYVYLNYKNSKKQFMEDLKIIKEQKYIITSDKISIISGTKQIDMSYNDFKSIKENKKFFILNHRSKVTIAIPKRYIAPEDLASVRGFFLNKKSSDNAGR
ncbi:MAG TPA: YcxB family protein [Exilispira sp.]|nr:YcxB family protein [Spirochaetota bacterium]HOV46836.1 YcxB family protein [Exilispira sp.]HPB47365.1 YcxB family protein [Exilispira sp.]HQJ41258.1 YcxB family protein [Exilispira sp.]HQM89673.1 YcxB family protein [Exilispira sp.]